MARGVAPPGADHPPQDVYYVWAFCLIAVICFGYMFYGKYKDAHRVNEPSFDQFSVPDLRSKWQPKRTKQLQREGELDKTV
jgi:hypothetical protein